VLPAREQEASSDELDAIERGGSCLVAMQRQLQTVPRGVCNRTNYAAENLGNLFKLRKVERNEDLKNSALKSDIQIF